MDTLIQEPIPKHVLQVVCEYDKTLFLSFLLTPLLTGMVVAYITRHAVVTWYQDIHKPWFTPPDYAFGPAWTTLYLLMGYASYLVFTKSSERGEFPVLAVGLYALQFAMNQMWSLLFFFFKRWDLALANISLMILAILGCIFAFKQVDERAAYLMVPYLLFVCVAMSLNIGFIRLNPEFMKNQGMKKSVSEISHRIDVNGDKIGTQEKNKDKVEKKSN
eukprot:CAMPEP_0184693200 /NCGR_PEP_ID=MMETSP0313-20130426/1477_1 /TAXON_ID=2792 /ORGANISM="Porphyridium aerugineum, Strain SAG 1380-2" /LENGTH=217 /DNA_ID=CAMNT_0027151213 /DNA_START=469 /DNA_END=1122 /DNA_ORIENTATION=-